MKRFFAFAACAALLAACNQKPAEPQAKYNIEALPIAEYMGHVIDPAAFAYWAGSGTEETAAGTKQLAPTTEEGWEKVESAAAALIEAGNALQLPGRPRNIPVDAPQAEWMKFAQALTAEAILAKAAAEKKDPNGVYVEGAKLYEICTACHKKYVIDPMLKAGGRPIGTPLPDWPEDIKAKQRQLEGQSGK